MLSLPVSHFRSNLKTRHFVAAQYLPYRRKSRCPPDQRPSILLLLTINPIKGRVIFGSVRLIYLPISLFAPSRRASMSPLRAPYSDRRVHRTHSGGRPRGGPTAVKANDAAKKPKAVSLRFFLSALTAVRNPLVVTLDLLKWANVSRGAGLPRADGERPRRCRGTES